MAHAVQKVVERCEAAEENGGLMGENSLTQLFHSSVKLVNLVAVIPTLFISVYQK